MNLLNIATDGFISNRSPLTIVTDGFIGAIVAVIGFVTPRVFIITSENRIYMVNPAIS